MATVGSSARRDIDTGAGTALQDCCCATVNSPYSSTAPPWTHLGDTWGLPGGARDSDETVIEGALREAGEEARIDRYAIRPVATLTVDHGGWAYSTVVAAPRSPDESIAPHAANAESVDVRWCDDEIIDSLPLHPGFAHAWPLIRALPVSFTIVVDAEAVIDQCSADSTDSTDSANGRRTAINDLTERLRVLALTGLDITELLDAGHHRLELPVGMSSGRLHPRFLLVTDRPDLVSPAGATDVGHVVATSHPEALLDDEDVLYVGPGVSPRTAATAAVSWLLDAIGEATRAVR